MINLSQYIDRADRQIIAATQDGLPLVVDPYGAVGKEVGLSGAEVRSRMQRMLACGIIRRIGAVPNHYALGLKANGMSVWDVDDDRIAELGVLVGALDFVSHCYARPRHLPHWPYNLFAMVHSDDRVDVHRKVEEIAAILGSNARAHDVLFSTRILKKTGLRIATPQRGKNPCSV